MGTLRYAFITLAVLAAHVQADNIQEADKLFAEGLALRDTNLQQSCERFQQSLELNRQAIGTLMNVALCDEKLGRIASAVRHFSEARDRAKEGNLPEYIAEAEKKIDEISPDLPYVELKFLAGREPNTRVLMGDEVIPEGELDKKIMVNPGEVVIVVSAPNKLAFETRVMINKKETKVVQVPALKKGVTVKSSRRTIGIITTSIGGAAFAAGVVLGFVANSRYQNALDDCETREGKHVCTPDAHSKAESAITLGNVGTVVGGVGLAAAGVGVFLWLTAPKEKQLEKRVTIVPTFTSESTGLTAIGRF